MSDIQALITEHLAIWTGADNEKKSGRGRASGSAASVYGVKKLRELILELAVRGKLVPQEASDEPASELLKRIGGNFKTIQVEHYPCDLPQGWEWIKFGDLLDFQGGGQPPKHAFSDIQLEGYVQLIQIRDLGEKPQPVFIKKELAAKFCTPQDIMIGRYGASVGKVFWGQDGAYNVALVKIIDKYSIYYNRFLFEFFRCPLGQSFFSGISRSAQAGFNKSDIEGQLMPLPPLAEQHRIVAKVDELMTLCDQLENQHSNAIVAHEKLVSYLLNTLTQSQDAAEFNESWQRIAANFDTLFSSETSIDALKQTVLQLAVMGKLVPQDASDEPASELLKRIQAEKAKLITEGKIKKDKPLAAIADDEKPFELPKGWEWVSFGFISEFINGDRGKNYPNRDEYVEKGMPWINTGHIEPDGTLSICDMNYITKEKFDILNGGKIESDDLVYCLRGATFGKTAFVLPYREGAVASSLMIIRPYISDLRFFIYKYLISPFGKSQVYRFNNGSAQPNLSSGSVGLYAFPLPPLAEQHRIVAKVDELMAICDQLKTRITAANQLQQKLADVLVAQAVA